MISTTYLHAVLQDASGLPAQPAQSPPEVSPAQVRATVTPRDLNAGVCSRASRVLRIVYESRRADRGPVLGFWSPWGDIPSFRTAAAEARRLIGIAFSAVPPRLEGCGLAAWHLAQSVIR